MNKKRIGVFGGTFNPPHIGHVAAAKAFIKSAELDKLIIMPAFIPPHKEYTSSVSCEDRFQMCKLAFSEIENAEVSDLEISRGGKSYTYLTLQELSNSEYDLYFLCGTDMILTLGAWKNPDIIFELANICYIRREDDPEISIEIEKRCKEYKEKYAAKIQPIVSEVIDISSSEVRNGEVSLKSYLSPSVLEYINKTGLYK